MHSLLEVLSYLHHEDAAKKHALAAILTGIANDIVDPADPQQQLRFQNLINYMCGIESNANIDQKTDRYIIKNILNIADYITNNISKSEELYDKFSSELCTLGFVPPKEFDIILALTNNAETLAHMQQFYNKIKPKSDNTISFDLKQPNFVNHAIEFVSSAPDNSNIVILCKMGQTELLKKALTSKVNETVKLSISSYGMAGFCEFLKKSLEQEQEMQLSLGTPIIRKVSNESIPFKFNISTPGIKYYNRKPRGNSLS